MAANVAPLIDPDVSVLAILQARMSASRLPGKVLMEVQGKPLLQLMMERVQLCKTFSNVVVATTSEVDDDAIEVHMKQTTTTIVSESLNLLLLLHL